MIIHIYRVYFIYKFIFNIKIYKIKIKIKTITFEVDSSHTSLIESFVLSFEILTLLNYLFSPSIE
jgi:hypothetical protein